MSDKNIKDINKETNTISQEQTNANVSLKETNTNVSLSETNTHFLQKDVIEIPKKLLNSFQKKGNIFIASFDIGAKNFSFYIEKLNKDISNIENIPKCQRYNLDGTSTDKFKSILKKVYLNGESIVHENTSISENCNDDKYLDPKIFYNLTRLLDKYINYWDLCDYIVIEQQMSFNQKAKPNFGYGKGKGKWSKPAAKINTKAIKIGQHVFSYFVVNYMTTKKVFEFPSYYKTQILGAKKGLGDRERKKWSPEVAISIFDERGDIKSLGKIINSKKKDDLADTLLQCQAFKYLYFIEKAL